jgi:hypothetical protein
MNLQRIINPFLTELDETINLFFVYETLQKRKKKVYYTLQIHKPLFFQCSEFCRFRTKPWGLVFFLQNLKRFCTKLKKVLWRRFFRSIQGKNLLGFVEFFYGFFWHFNSFRSFLTSTKPFWGVWEKTIFFESVYSLKKLGICYYWKLF